MQVMESLSHSLEHFSAEPLWRWMRAHTAVADAFALSYVLFVLLVPRLMAGRAPLRLRAFSAAWNLGLTLFSVGGAVVTARRLVENMTAAQISGLAPKRGDGPNAAAPVIEGSFYTSVCVWNDGFFLNGPLGLFIALFVMSKVLELIDTVLLVLQKKPVIFLHWYHHFTVLLFCWRAYVNEMSSSLWFGTMNYSVHTIMYFYYFMCACGWRKVVRPIAPLITTLQILQMVMGTFVVVYATYHRHISGYGCDVDDTNLKLGLLMYVSYLVLFVQLFYRNYVSSSGNKKK